MKSWINSVSNPSLKKVAIIGAKGSAKSTANFETLLAMIIKGNCRILLTCGTSEQVKKLFKQKLWEDLKNIPVHSSNFQTMEFVFVTGAELHLKSVETYKTAEGLEYDAWFADEFQDHSKEAVEVFHSRTRRRKDNCIFRIVGMPDDPEHFMYKYFDENGYTLHEITLFDHPDQNWIDFYSKELAKIYSGAMLDRYLYGKRVSLSGLGAFRITQEHKGEFVHDEPNKEDLLFSWDFNNEYRAVTVWQSKKIEGFIHAYCIASHQMSEVTVQEDAKKLCEMYSDYSGQIYLTGDASGDSKSAQTSESMWVQVKREFKEAFGLRLRYIVPRSNPNVKDTIQLVNYALVQNRVYFGNNAIQAFRALTASKLDKFGEIDKSKDYSNAENKSHEVDTIRYALWHFIEDFPSKKKVTGRAVLL